MSDIFQQHLDISQIIIAPGFEEVEGYVSLPLRNLSVGWDVPFDVYLKIKNKGEITPQIVKCCDRGEVFQESWYEKLLLLKIPCVYVSIEEIERLLQYLHHNLEQALRDDTKSDLEKGMLVCDATHMWTLNFFNTEKARTGEQIQQGLQFVDTLFEVIRGDRHNLLYLMEIRRHSFRLYTHCLNVCLLGLAFTSYLGWDRGKIRGFGLGALIHDIGLTTTPQVILEKKEALTEDEMSKVKRHPFEGFRIMQAFVNLRWEALQMVLQHHENGDGSGYPEGLKITAIHPWGRLLRILDSYEAMTAERPWRPAMEPKEALQIMVNDWEKSKLFDPNYLKTFIRFLASK
jgi:HD-GYP domain-containing protein (c-di-GMP phosphodiesterase class II)